MKKINSFFIFYPLCCILIFLRLEIFYGSDVKAPFTDDFYYYLTTAKNYINLGVVTFDKISLPIRRPREFDMVVLNSMILAERLQPIRVSDATGTPLYRIR